MGEEKKKKKQTDKRDVNTNEHTTTKPQDYLGNA